MTRGVFIIDLDGGAPGENHPVYEPSQEEGFLL